MINYKLAQRWKDKGKAQRVCDILNSESAVGPVFVVIPDGSKFTLADTQPLVKST